MYKGVCPICKTKFDKGYSNKKYCTRLCQDKASYLKRKRAAMSIVDRQRIEGVKLLLELGYKFNEDGMKWEDTKPSVIIKSVNTELPVNNKWEEAYKEYYKMLTATYGKNHMAINIQVVISALENFARTRGLTL